MIISFVTKWCDYFPAPLVSIYRDTTMVSQAVPLTNSMVIEDENGRMISDPSARKVGYTEHITADLRERYKFFTDKEVAMIVDFLTNSDNFACFSHLEKPQLQGEQASA